VQRPVKNQSHSVVLHNFFVHIGLCSCTTYEHEHMLILVQYDFVDCNTLLDKLDSFVYIASDQINEDDMDGVRNTHK
jgi:hypothetical protein